MFQRRRSSSQVSRRMGRFLEAHKHSLGSPGLSSRVGYAASMPSPSREFSAGELNATDSCWLEGSSVLIILLIALYGAESVISLGFAVSTLSIRSCRSIGRRPRLQLHRPPNPPVLTAIVPSCHLHKPHGHQTAKIGGSISASEIHLYSRRALFPGCDD